jgi:hypothetical protein
MKKILLIATALLISTQVNAGPGCKAKDLNGNYVMYQAAINHHFHTGKCEVNISNGNLTGHCAFDPSAENPVNFNGPVYGTATINSNCSAVATISFDPVPNVVHIDSDFDLQFTPDKQSFIGKFINTFGVEGTTSGTRYSPLLPATPAPQHHHSDDNNEES